MGIHEKNPCQTNILFTSVTAELFRAKVLQQPRRQMTTNKKLLLMFIIVIVIIIFARGICSLVSLFSILFYMCS